jgi:hypothetical protein
MHASDAASRFHTPANSVKDGDEISVGVVAPESPPPPQAHMGKVNATNVASRTGDSFIKVLSLCVRGMNGHLCDWRRQISRFMGRDIYNTKELHFTTVRQGEVAG